MPKTRKRDAEKGKRRLRSAAGAGNIAFVEVEEERDKLFLRKGFEVAGKLIFQKKTANECFEDIRQASVLSVFIKSKVDEKLIGQMPNLKLITTRSTGFDHIDLAGTKKRGIAVANVPAYGENTVAEHTFALILSLARNLRKAYLRTVRNDFSLEGLIGFDLKGKTLGVVGTGHIGLHVIRIGVGFGMKVRAFDVRENHFLSEVMNFSYVPFETLLKESDIVSLHVPYIPPTHHLINKKNIHLIKKGAVLINTSRGGLVDTEALVHALDKGILAGAGLDVLEGEEFILEETRFLQDAVNQRHWEKLQTVLGNHVLLNRENVIYTPHMAFYSLEAVQRILETTVENIKAFQRGAPINIVA